MKDRLDKVLFELGYFETKNKAQAAIMAGDVKIDDIKITKAGTKIEYSDKMKIEIKTMPYVSRGGFKLEKAVSAFNIDLKDKICLDAGASTGGFTDCMLQNGAKKVYSVDVGYGQFAWKLRTDSRVKVIERVNIKNCDEKDIFDESDEHPNFCATDLSFISVTKVLPNIKKMMQTKNIEIVTLIKPQFEAGKEEVGKNGVVRDKNTHIKVIEGVLNFGTKIGLIPLNLTISPIKGPAGNIEYLAYFSDIGEKKSDFNIIDTVEKAFEIL